LKRHSLESHSAKCLGAGILALHQFAAKMRNEGKGKNFLDNDKVKSLIDSINFNSFANVAKK